MISPISTLLSNSPIVLNAVFSASILFFSQPETFFVRTLKCDEFTIACTGNSTGWATKKAIYGQRYITNTSDGCFFQTIRSQKGNNYCANNSCFSSSFLQLIHFVVTGLASSLFIEISSPQDSQIPYVLFPIRSKAA